MDKVILAYSGGLDTSVCIQWLKEKKNLNVITFSADVGQGDDFEELCERALNTGASSAHVSDLKEELVTDYIFPSIRANAVYEDNYFLATALSRPLIAREMVNLAEEHSCWYFSHGCTGKGNDQVRIEAGIAALAPNKKIIAPLREWDLESREAEIDYARRFTIPVPVTKESPYSIDSNLWGVSIECGALEDPWNAPPEDAYRITVSPEKAPDKPEVIEIEFADGIPVALNGNPKKPVALIEELNKVAGAHGVGRSDMVENRLVGIKSREVYEAPAAEVIFRAHKALEALVLDRETLHFQDILSRRYAEIVYNGLWFSTLREALDSFFSRTQKYVEGVVRVRLYKGTCTVTGRKSGYSLYNKSLSTYSNDDIFRHESAEGFIDIWSLPLRVEHDRRNRNS